MGEGALMAEKYSPVTSRAESSLYSAPADLTAHGRKTRQDKKR
jgi:hypothetical protein